MQIHELPEYSGEPSTDDVFPLDTGTHTFKLPFSGLGEAIITTATATISGVVQTAKAAIEALGTRVGAIETFNTWATVNITLSPGANCSGVTLQNAYRTGNVLFIKFAVSPSSGLSSGDNVDVTVSGMPTPKIVADYRIGVGVIGTVLYSSWIVNATTIRCRRMTADAWTTNGVVFSGVIPLA